MQQLKNDVDMIWASSKGMHMLTASQLQNYKIDCDKYKAIAVSYKTKGVGDFQQYITEFMKPFQIKLKFRSIKIVLDIKFGPSAITSDLCTDWKMYESVFYHLMQNAIKYSPTNSEIKVTIELKPLL